MLARDRLEERLQDLHLDVARQQVLDDGAAVRLEEVLARVLDLGRRFDREQSLDRRHLRQRRAELAVEQIDLVDLLIAEEGQGTRRHRAHDLAERQDSHVDVVRANGRRALLVVVEALPADDNERSVFPLPRDEDLTLPDDARVERAAKSAVGRQHDEQHPRRLRGTRLYEPVLAQTRLRREVGDHLTQLLPEGAPLNDGVLRATQLRRRDHFHRLRDLLRAADGRDPLADGLEARHYAANRALNSSSTAFSCCFTSAVSSRFSRSVVSSCACFASTYSPSSVS